MHRVRQPRLAPLAALALLLTLAACGGTPPVTLALTGVSPSVALPGDTVKLQGAGFRPGQTVAFDGASATVTATTATTITAVVPFAYGYPVITVTDPSDAGEVAVDGALFVGADYAGPATLDGVQAALDGLPLGAALRLAAGTYGAPGTDLDLDNRQLHGAGPTTVLEVPGTLLMWAQDPHATVLADLRVNGNVTRLVRGRVTTTAADPWVSGSVLLDRVRLDLAAFVVDQPTFQTIVVRDATIAVDDLTVVVMGGSLTIEGSDLTVTNLANLQGQGADLALRGSTLMAANVTLVTAPLGELELDDVELTAADVVAIVAQGGNVRVRAARLTADTGTLSLVAYGKIEATDSTLRAGTSATAQSLFGGITLRDTVVESGAGDMTLVTDGPLVVDGGRLDAATTLVLVSETAGDLTLVRTQDITAGTDLILYGSASFGGNNGTVRVLDNARISAGQAFVISPGAADLEVADNGPITANLVAWQATRNHVTVRSNVRIESSTDILVVADQPGGRLTATGNAFVASGGAGTITLATQAGELTLADNTYDGDLQTPNNP
jgi:hypothetical protein